MKAPQIKTQMSEWTAVHIQNSHEQILFREESGLCITFFYTWGTVHIYIYELSKFIKNLKKSYMFFSFYFICI
jgi:hypothetical protein